MYTDFDFNWDTKFTMEVEQNLIRKDPNLTDKMRELSNPGWRKMFTILYFIILYLEKIFKIYLNFKNFKLQIIIWFNYQNFITGIINLMEFKIFIKYYSILLDINLYNFNLMEYSETILNLDNRGFDWYWIGYDFENLDFTKIDNFTG